MSQTNKPAKTGNVPSTTGISHQKSVARSSIAILVGGSPYKLGKRIGKGNFGEVRYGKNTKNNEDVAIKTEPTNTKKPQLYLEFQTYKLLGATNKLHTMNGIPKVFHYGLVDKLQYNALVLELLGPSLEDLFNICGRKFTLKTIMMIGIHTLRIIEIVHNKGIVFRDIKPENFVVGQKSKDKTNTIHIIDFGLSKAYIDQTTRKHVPYREKVTLTGTPRYMSINTHLGKEQSRRDDLEALGHMYMYLVLGHLPWQGLTVKSSKERFQKICAMKRKIPVGTLCDEHPEMAEYLNYVRHLGFNETPNYVYLRDLFTGALQKNGLEDDQCFDWKDKPFTSGKTK